MDFQTFVNETFHKLARQGQQSMRRDPLLQHVVCAYNGPNGTHCAIGFWLDPGVVDVSNNTTAISAVWHLLPNWMREFDYTLIRLLQYVHDLKDNWRDPQSLIDAMKEYAKMFGVIFDATIEPEVWANWKGNPPLTDPVMPALPAAKALAPELATV